jgi:hypothetical protein
MSKKANFISLITLLVFFFMYSTTCARSMISGQVVDADTGKPIEKAAYYIYWYKINWFFGLTSGVDVETAEGYTNADGYFKLPKYSTFFKEYRMAIYKSGYVCWNSDKIFPTWEDRKDFQLENKMVIKLEKFKEGYSKEDHARFTIFSKLGTGPSGAFRNAIQSEIDLYFKIDKK